MKKIMLLLLVSAILTGIASAQGYEIKVKIHHIPNDTVILGHHFNERLIPDDTVVLDHKCEGVFRGKEKLPVGMYFLFLPSHNYFDILVDGNQKFTIENDTTEFLKNMIITGSIENQVFHDYQEMLNSSTKEYREADVVHLHWVNQRLLSLGQLREMVASGKKILWTLHDEWPYLGLEHYRDELPSGATPFLDRMGIPS
jgi:hypothetical protein